MVSIFNLGILLVLVSAVAHAATIVLNTGMDWQSALKGSISPGTTIIMEAGTYTATVRLGINFPGTAAQPIIWKAQDGAAVTVQRNDASENLIDLKGSYFTVANMTFKGGSRGLRMGDGDTNMMYGTFSNLVVSDTADTAVSCNDGSATYSYFKFVDVNVARTGAGTSECFYVGCHNNGCTFRHGLFQRVSCFNTLSALTDYGSGVQIKTGSYNNTVSQSVFIDTKGPGVLIYDSYGLGNNIVDSNLVINAGNYGIQFTSGAVISNNIVISSTFHGLGASNNQVQSSVSNLKIVGNTVLSTDGLYATTIWSSASNIQVLNNALLGSGKSFEYTGGTLPGTITIANNARVGSVSGSAASWINVTSAASAVLSATSPYDVYPSASSLLKSGGSTTGPTLVSTDFACQTRTSPVSIGAYHYAGSTNPGPSLCSLYPTGATGKCGSASSRCASGTTTSGSTPVGGSGSTSSTSAGSSNGGNSGSAASEIQSILSMAW